jgi:two-component system cell cycle sensor histidine kinase PleC
VKETRAHFQRQAGGQWLATLLHCATIVSLATLAVLIHIRWRNEALPSHADAALLASGIIAGASLAALAVRSLRMAGATSYDNASDAFLIEALSADFDVWAGFWDLAAGRIWLPAEALDRLGLYADGHGRVSYGQFQDRQRGGDDLYAAISKALREGRQDVEATLTLRPLRGKWLEFSLKGRVLTAAGKRLTLAFVLKPKGDSAGAGNALQRAGLLARAIELLPEALVYWDSEDRLALCSNKFRDLYGLPDSAACLGATFTALSALSGRAILQGPVAENGERKTKASLYSARLPSGVWLQIAERPVAGGGFISLATDITALKLSEQRLSERERELKTTVSDLEISRLQLQRQTRQLVDLAEKYANEKARAEAASRSKSEFLANISHELRTPLNAIIGFSEMMSQEMFGRIGNRKYLEYAADIHKSGQYLLEVINDILDMSKIEAGRMSLSLEMLQTSDIIEESLRVVAQTAAARHITLQHQGNRSIEVLGDRRALKQVLINLLANAIKFTPVGGMVTLRAYRYKGTVRIAIADTGVGIPKPEIARLGRPFEQVENQFAKAHKGTGLGLAISRSIIELHGGRLEIKSKLGEGTTVTCILPSQHADLLESEAA